VPTSWTYAIAIIDHGACIIVSYEKKIVCGNRDWTDVAEFGREGEGPGEYRNPSALVGGPGTVGVVDVGLRRLTVLDGAGRLQFTAPIPFMFRAVAAFDSSISGTYDDPQDAAGTMYATVSLPSGEVRSETYLPHPSEVGAATGTLRGLSRGARSPTGELAFITGGREVVRYSARGELIDVFPAPAYEEELPNARDIAEFSSHELFGRLPSSQEVQTFAEEPKRYAIRDRSAAYDGAGRLWILTQRDRADVSWFDVYEGSTFLGSVKVRDRVYGFDIKDRILATLVERPNLDREGLRVRAIDWYEIVEPDE
jgi:hypothetical protein